MKVMIAIPCLLHGGTEIQSLNLVRVLAEAGHAVVILCYFEHDQEMVNEFFKTGCKVELMKLQRGIRPWKLVVLLYKKYKEFNPDVVHVQYMAPGALPILAARLAGVKKILATVHQPYTASHGMFAKLMLWFSANLCTRFITVSQNAEISWFGNGQLFNENKSLKTQPRHFTIYNAVDVECIQDIQRRTDLQKEKHKSGIPSGQFVIGAVSRLRHEKGIDTLISAFAQVLKKIPNVHLLIVGTGPDETKLKELVVTGYGLRVSERGTMDEEQLNRLRVTGYGLGVLGSEFRVSSSGAEHGTHITFFGEADWKTAMQQMALMDVIVVPSRFEGFGLTAAEAMAMGKAVAATEVFGLSEVVTDEETGLLFPLEEIEALADCLSRLISDPVLRSTLGANGKLKAENLFDISVFSGKTTRLYEMLSEKC